jgi:hypothetical protein
LSLEAPLSLWVLCGDDTANRAMREYRTHRQASTYTDRHVRPLLVIHRPTVGTKSHPRVELKNVNS